MKITGFDRWALIVAAIGGFIGGFMIMPPGDSYPRDFFKVIILCGLVVFAGIKIIAWIVKQVIKVLDRKKPE